MRSRRLWSTHSSNLTARVEPRPAIVRLRCLQHPTRPRFSLRAARYSTTSNTRTHDDATLGRVFDDPEFWRSYRRSDPINRGLFQNAHLTTPQGFHAFAQQSVRKCQKLVARVVEEKDEAQKRQVLQDLDRLSDLLCRVLDSTEFVRNNHPDTRIQEAASTAHAQMYEYMNVLNTCPELNHRLQAAYLDPSVGGRWTTEEKRVADTLLSDFSNSAIDLPERERQKFVGLSNDIAQYGDMVINGMRPVQLHLSFPSSKLKGMNPVRIKNMSRFRQARLSLVKGNAHHALQTVEDEDVRQQIYVANRTSHHDQIEVLDQMLKARAEIARLSKYESYAHMILPTKVSQSPEAVNSFLQSLMEDNYPRIRDERDQLLKRKAGHLGVGLDSLVLKAWDWEFYARQQRTQQLAGRRSEERLAEFFPLGSVMQGLSRLFSRLYGISLVPRETSEGEVWNDEVRRLDVISHDGRHLAVVYCDLFERDGKSPNPAHFTLRSARRISSEEEAEAVHEPGTPLNDGMSISSRDPKTGAVYQLPTIALVCDFAPPSNRKKPTLLNFRDVQTLFHEMGHAVHSFLGRTEYQNVAGTRCPTDFAELPSVIMENFAAAPEVLQLFAKHYETGDPLPYRLVQERLVFENMVKNMETEVHILQAMLDQACHSSLAGDSGFSSTKLFHDIWNVNATLQEPAHTSWQGFFGHLVHYGAVYYAYLFDRAISGKIWSQVFQNPENSAGAISPEAGELFKEQVLKWGGSRDGWECIAGVLNRPELSKGGKEAMEEVGRWGVASNSTWS